VVIDVVPISKRGFITWSQTWKTALETAWDIGARKIKKAKKDRLPYAVIYLQELTSNFQRKKKNRSCWKCGNTDVPREMKRVSGQAASGAIYTPRCFAIFNESLVMGLLMMRSGR
jgi:hypothetical protein